MPYAIITLALKFWHSQVEQAQINETVAGWNLLSTQELKSFILKIDLKYDDFRWLCSKKSFFWVELKQLSTRKPSHIQTEGDFTTT